jgi:hypothetical protein
VLLTKELSKTGVFRVSRNTGKIDEVISAQKATDQTLQILFRELFAGKVQILESVQIVTREFIYPASKHETR